MPPAMLRRVTLLPAFCGAIGGLGSKSEKVFTVGSGEMTSASSSGVSSGTMTVDDTLDTDVNLSTFIP